MKTTKYNLQLLKEYEKESPLDKCKTFKIKIVESKYKNENIYI
jgi:hypothetical protein